MKYYRIHPSINKKVLGHYPQQKETIFHCSIDDEPRFVEHIYSKKVDFEPIVANAVLYSSSLATDLIYTRGVGFSHKPLISGRLKAILQRYRATGLQFFRAPIVHKDRELEDYWILNFYEIEMDYIDFPKSEIFLTKNSFEKVEKLHFNSFQEFTRKKLEVERIGYSMGISIERYKLKETIDQDFFMLTDVEGGVNFMVSEDLKREIEHTGCTGIEFMPSELRFKEWLYYGERDRIYAKT